MNSESFVFYESFYKQFQILKEKNPDDALRWIDAVFRYGLYKEEPDENDEIRLYGFEQTITSISKAKERYKASVENGKKGGRPEIFKKEDVLALKEQGLTNQEIAKELGCSDRTVSRKLQETKPDKTQFCSMTEERTKGQNLNDNVNENINYNKNINPFISLNKSEIEMFNNAKTDEERAKILGF